MKTNFEVIDQFFSAQMSANESEATLKALRPQVEEAVKELIRQQGKPANFTGTLDTGITSNYRRMSKRRVRT